MRWRMALFNLTGMASVPPLIMKLAMPVSLTSILSRKRARRRTNRYASFTLKPDKPELKGGGFRRSENERSEVSSLRPKRSAFRYLHAG